MNCRRNQETFLPRFLFYLTTKVLTYTMIQDRSEKGTVITDKELLALIARY